MSEQIQADVEPQPEAKDVPVKQAATKSNSIFNAFLTLLSLITFIAIGVLGYMGYQQAQQMTGRLLTLEQQSANSQSEMEQVKNSLNSDFKELQNQLQKQLQLSLTEQNVSEQLSAIKRQIQSVSGRHQSDWLLAEADYLVRIAANRLLLERDHVTALALLISADERIKLIDDPGLQSAREALARDIAALRLLKRDDIAGIAIRIGGLIPQLKTLPVLVFQLPEDAIEVIEQADGATETNWFDNLKKSITELSVKWFEIRDHGRPVTPLMAPEIEALLINNMNLLLQTTQFACLRQQEDLYHHSLEQLKARVTEYFDLLDPVVSAFLSEIDSLNSLTIKSELPETLESRVIIARLLDQRLQQPSALLDTQTGEQQ